MNKLTFLLATLLATTFLFSSCKKDNNGGSGTAAEGTITFKVDGQKVTTLDMVTMGTNQSGTLHVQGNTGGTSSQAIEFTIAGFNGVGTYELGNNMMNTAAYVETEIDLNDPANPQSTIWGAPHGNGSNKNGEIKISEITATNVKGSFEFTVSNGSDIRNITSGVFNVKLQ